MDQNDNHKMAINPACLTIADLSLVLSKVGGQSVTEAMLTAIVAAGAPTNADGSINLLHLGAWLVKVAD